MTRHIEIKLPVTDEFLADVLTTAIESPFGPWFQWNHIQHFDAEGRVKCAELHHDTEEGNEGDLDGHQQVDLPIVARGLQTILSKRHVAPGYTGDILAAVVENDTSHLDMITADAIIQAAVFGKVVFG